MPNLNSSQRNRLCAGVDSEFRPPITSSPISCFCWLLFLSFNSVPSSWN